MDQVLLLIAAVCFLLILCNAYSLVALVAMVWCSYHWLGIYASVVITLFWLRTGPVLPKWPRS